MPTKTPAPRQDQIAPAIPAAPAYIEPQAAPSAPVAPVAPSYDEKASAINRYRKAVDIYFRTEGGDHDIAGRMLDAATQGLVDLGLTPADTKPATGQALTSRAQGLYGQAGAAPSNQATDYDVIQDQVAQAAAGLANNAINNTQTNAQGINTVGNQVAQNVVAIGQNAAAVQTLQQQQNAQQTTNGTFVTQTDFKNSQDAQDNELNAVKADKAEKTQVNQIDGRVTTIEGDVKDLRTTKADKTDLDPLKTDIAGNKSNIANKADQTALDTTNQTVATNTSNITTLTTQVGTKVGQAEVDQAIAVEDQKVVTNAGNITTLTTQMGTKVGQTEVDQAVSVEDRKVTANTVAIANEDGKVATNSKLISANKQAIDSQTQLEAQHYTALSTGVSTNAAGVAANRRDIDATHTQVQSNTRTLANHEKRITALEQQNNKMFSNMDKRLDENRDHANAGISAALAASQIPQVSQNRDFSVGAGVGTYGDQQAVAVGFSARINERMVTKFAVTGDSQQNFGAAAGASYEW